MYCAPRLLKENPERFQIIDYIFHLAMATKCDTISSSGFKIQYGLSEVICARDHVLFYLFLCACTFPALNICLYISYFSLIGTSHFLFCFLLFPLYQYQYLLYLPQCLPFLNISISSPTLSIRFFLIVIMISISYHNLRTWYPRDTFIKTVITCVLSTSSYM